ncbi:MAG: DNA-binding response regulator [Bacilli bacterium]|nr:DNA-binding response regulator [Bacilli bacterium]
MQRSKIQVMLADDHTLFRQGLRRVFELEDDIEIIGEASDGLTIAQLALQYKPDVVIMDINMPGKSGVEATRDIRMDSAEIKVLILSIHDDEEYVFETIRAGANGYLLKDVESEMFVEAVRQVSGGASFVHPRITTKLLTEFQRLSNNLHAAGYADGGDEESPAWQEILTAREMEILSLMAQGKSNRSIGQALYISEKTVKNHVSSVLSKLDVDDRTQAVILAAQKSWVKL